MSDKRRSKGKTAYDQKRKKKTDPRYRGVSRASAQVTSQGSVPTLAADVDGPVVRVSMGAGVPEVLVSLQPNDTVGSILARANLVIERGETAMMGRRRVDKPWETPVKPGDVIVVAGTPANG